MPPEQIALTVVSPWTLATFLAGLVATWSLVIIGTIRWMMSRQQSQQDRAWERLDRTTRKLEIDMLEMKADLPLNYVRKEDFIRHEVVINTKLDRLRDLIAALKEKSNEC